MDSKEPGKLICSALKEIRKQIAQENNIPLNTVECSYQGPCEGTCSRCDAEIHYLNEELLKKQLRGEPISIKGVGKEAVNNIHFHGSDAVKLYQKPEVIIDHYACGKETGLEENIDELELCVRTYNALKRAGINSVNELCNLTKNEVVKIRNIDSKNLSEIEERLAENGRCLKPEEYGSDDDLSLF